MARFIGIGLIVVLAVFLGAFSLYQTRNLRSETQLRASAVAVHVTAETALKASKQRISELQTEKDAADAALKMARTEVNQLKATETALKAARDEIGQLQNNAGIVEAALKAAKDQISQLQTAKEAAEKALEEAKKPQ